MLIKYTDKYVNIYFNMKITFSKELVFQPILHRLFYKYHRITVYCTHSIVYRTDGQFIVRMVNLSYLYDKIIVRLGTFRWVP